MQRTLNDIIPPSKRRAMGQEVDTSASEGPQMPRIRPGKRPKGNGGSRRFPMGTAIVALIVVLGCGAAFYAFASTSVEITPTTNEAYVSSDFTATAGAGELPFEVITVETTVSKPVPAESSENANDPAQGTITIYNEQPTNQTLIKNTRFESPDGLIYRIRDSVSVPAGSAGKPGTLNATVYADAAGESYNIGATNFTIPGLKGSSAFDAVYAKSTSSMQGGFTGIRPSVSEATRDREVATLQSTLASDLDKAMAEKLPDGYVLIPGASFSTYETLPDSAGSSGNVDVKQKGTMTAVVFPNEALAKAVAYTAIGTYTGQPILLSDVSNLSLSSGSGSAPVGAETYVFTLTGDAVLTWEIDTARIAGAVAGKSREGAQLVLSGFPEVDRAVLIIRPFWSTSFPNDPEKVKVTVSEAS
ncbi:hypothetical protein KKH15_00560 [Patescibacteria group bacterium]|nr:hypothetical protein [Patescibacteria group bacterium]MBU1755147.1 hypothetical protein [Patescibacteria group bacterium]